MNQNWHKYPTYLEGRCYKDIPDKSVRVDQKEESLYKAGISFVVALGLIYGCSLMGDKIHKNGIIDKERQTHTNNIERIVK